MLHLLRSESYASQASFGLGIGGILNIVLAPLFMLVILPAGQRVTGAPIAIMLSNVIALCYSAIIFVKLRHNAVLSVAPRGILPGTHYAGTIFLVGFPSAIGGLLSCVSNMVISKLAFGYGDIPIATLGIVLISVLFLMNTMAELYGLA